MKQNDRNHHKPHTLQPLWLIKNKVATSSVKKWAGVCSVWLLPSTCDNTNPVCESLLVFTSLCVNNETLTSQKRAQLVFYFIFKRLQAVRSCCYYACHLSVHTFFVFSDLLRWNESLYVVFSTSFSDWLDKSFLSSGSLCRCTTEQKSNSTIPGSFQNKFDNTNVLTWTVFSILGPHALAFPPEMRHCFPLIVQNVCFD